MRRIGLVLAVLACAGQGFIVQQASEHIDGQPDDSFQAQRSRSNKGSLQKALTSLLVALNPANAWQAAGAMRGRGFALNDPLGTQDRSRSAPPQVRGVLRTDRQRVLEAGLHMAVDSNVTKLSKLPPGVSEYSTMSDKEGSLDNIRVAVARGISAAVADGLELIEVEFPPLIDIKKVISDYSNVQVLDANRDFSMQLAIEPRIRAVAPSTSLWVVFPDNNEVELARKAWPGQRYQDATQTSIVDGVTAVGGDPLIPVGFRPALALMSIFGAGPAPAPVAELAPPKLQIVVQPGDCGPMEDWMNMERLKSDGVPMVCFNGALDKVCSGYYGDLIFPNLAKCARNFFDKFEAGYYLKPVDTGKGWLYRVYPEPWQLYKELRTELKLIKTFTKRPTLVQCSRLIREYKPR